MSCRDQGRRPWMAGPRSPRAAGFTLLELVVAMSILVVMTGLLFMVVGHISDAVSHNEQNIEANQVARAVLDQITRDFERVAYLDGTVNMYQQNTGFVVGGAVPTSTIYLLS